jgi:hypothetical protein
MTNQNKNPHPSLLCSSVERLISICPQTRQRTGKPQIRDEFASKARFRSVRCKSWDESATEQEQYGSLPQPNARKRSILQLRVNKQGAMKYSDRKQWGQIEEECLRTTAAVWRTHLHKCRPGGGCGGAR